MNEAECQSKLRASLFFLCFLGCDFFAIYLCLVCDFSVFSLCFSVFSLRFVCRFSRLITDCSQSTNQALTADTSS